MTKCSHVGTFADPNIPRTALCIVGRRNACQTIQEACIKQLLSTSTTYLVSKAVDEEKTYSSLWLEVIPLMTKTLKEEQENQVYYTSLQKESMRLPTSNKSALALPRLHF